MTKKYFSIFVFIFIALTGRGQIHPKVGQIFYDLPLDKTRAELREIIARDKRFRSTDTLSEIVKDSIPYFRGVTSDKGVIKSKPDSIEIQLTFGHSASIRSKSGQADLLKFKYFYSVKDSVESEYQNLVKLLNGVFKDSSDIRVETPYSKGSPRYQYNASGKVFENFDPYYRVELLKATMGNNTFALFVEYSRPEK
jgi:hypothetical protein